MGYEVGSRVGDYEIIGILGAGGMGQVYKVRNTISDRVEAMKVLLPNLEGDSDLADRFMREIKVQASLDHPNIAALHTALRDGNQLLMFMEYVEGITLEDLMTQGPIPMDKAIDYMAQVLSALAYAHAKGVIHRDLKPANMILTPRGTVKLMDFGIAKLAADRKLTQTGRTVGSLYYMSPEQIQGAADLDPRSDLYSLGVAMYEILTGKRPFQGDSEYSIMAAHLEQTPAPLIEVNPALPPALNEIVLLAIQRDPAKRFQSAGAFRNALLSLKPAPVQAAAAPMQTAPSVSLPPPAPPAAAMPPRSTSRRGLYMALGSLVTVAVLIFAAIQIPKHLRTSAVSAPAAPAASVPSTPAAAASADATPQPAAPAPEVATPAPVAPSAVTPPPAAAKASARKPKPSAAPVQTAPPQPVQPQPAAPAAAAAPLAPSVDEKREAQLRKVGEQRNLLGIRSNSVKDGVESLRRAQSRQGLGLRSDISAAIERMDYRLAQTDAALANGDPVEAKKSLDAAEREVSTLEGFLGR